MPGFPRDSTGVSGISTAIPLPMFIALLTQTGLTTRLGRLQIAGNQRRREIQYDRCVSPVCYDVGGY